MFGLHRRSPTSKTEAAITARCSAGDPCVQQVHSSCMHRVGDVGKAISRSRLANNGYDRRVRPDSEAESIDDAWTTDSPAQKNDRTMLGFYAEPPISPGDAAPPMGTGAERIVPSENDRTTLRGADSDNDRTTMHAGA